VGWIQRIDEVRRLLLILYNIHRGVDLIAIVKRLSIFIYYMNRFDTLRLTLLGVKKHKKILCEGVRARARNE
jgi:hypothetical protein